MRWDEQPFGLNHPTWAQPACWFYATTDEALTTARRVYGKDSGHTVIRRVALSGPMGVSWTAFREVATV